MKDHYWRVWGIIFTFALLTLASCTKQPQGCRNCYFGPNIAAHYDPKNCIDLPGGSWRCDGVVFNPRELHVLPQGGRSVPLPGPPQQDFQ